MYPASRKCRFANFEVAGRQAEPAFDHEASAANTAHVALHLAASVGLIIRTKCLRLLSWSKEIGQGLINPIQKYNSSNVLGRVRPGRRVVGRKFIYSDMARPIWNSAKQNPRAQDFALANQGSIKFRITIT
jgi:hypothetical protein